MIMITVAMLLGLILCLLFGVPYVDIVKKKMFNQHIKDVVAETHAKKDGTPTTGGVFIILAIIIASLTTLMLAQKLNTTALIVLITLLFYTLAGYQDDFIKIKNKQNDGLSAKGKFLRQIVIAMLPIIYIMLKDTNATFLEFGYLHFNLSWLYPIFALFVITGSSNAFNLTDGLDGLSASCGVFAFSACAIIAFLNGYTEVAIIAATAVGALIGFLKYNKPKAQIFMGDTGSLALGGLLGTLAVVGKFELWLALIAIIFIVETLSVILQVTSFKTTGKRIFKMSPIHHHFELSGWSEKKIVIVFAGISALFSMISIVLAIAFFKGLL